MDIIHETLHFNEDIKLFPGVYFDGLSWAVLDIETLGLSPWRAPAILCGIVTPGADREDGSESSYVSSPGRPLNGCRTADVTQFYTESIAGTEDEETMLSALEDALADIDVLVTYNGRQFDLPYLAARRKKTHMPAMRERYDLDILQVVRYCTDIGKFVPNLRQKTLEDFYGIWDGRTDEISGRESISLYYEYLAGRDESLKEKILLHNRDDIVQLAKLTGVLQQADMHKAAFRYGFPVRSAGAPESPLLLVQKCEIKNGELTAEGIVSGGTLEDIRYGDERPSWRFLDGAFTLKVPLISHEGLLLADLDDVDAPVDPALITAGYIVLSQGRSIQYEHCTMLLKGLLTGILEQ